MDAELAVTPAPGGRALVERVAPPISPSLTRRASLNAAASLLDYAAKAIVTLAVTPILVGGLGRSLYGIWEMVARLGGFLTVAEGRPTEALRLIVAQKQGDADEAGLRRQVGAAFVVWLITLPLVLLAGFGLAWWVAPVLTRAPAQHIAEVRLTGLLLVATMLVTTLSSIPESVLRGMNLGYRRMGLQAGLNFLGGGLAAAAVWSGLGLVGLGEAGVVRALVAGLCFWLITRRNIKWYGAAMPTRSEVRSLLGMSVWLTAGDAIAKLMLASDVIILGAILGPAAVPAFALTGYAARTALGIHVFAAGAAMPGIGGLLGQGDRARAGRARRELLTLTWLFVTVVGAVILLWNRSFVALWVGGPYYAGPWVDLLIVLGLAQTAFIRTDSYLIDAALRPRQRVKVAALAAGLTVGLSIILTRTFGVVGLTCGIIAGRAIQSIAYPRLIRDARVGDGGGWRSALRWVVATSVLFAAAAVLGRQVLAPSWPIWIAGVLVTLPIVVVTALLAGLTVTERDSILRRLRLLRGRRGAR